METKVEQSESNGNDLVIVYDPNKKLKSAETKAEFWASTVSFALFGLALAVYVFSKFRKK